MSMHPLHVGPRPAHPPPTHQCRPPCRGCLRSQAALHERGPQAQISEWNWVYIDFAVRSGDACAVLLGPARIRKAWHAAFLAVGGAHPTWAGSPRRGGCWTQASNPPSASGNLPKAQPALHPDS